MELHGHFWSAEGFVPAAVLFSDVLQEVIHQSSVPERYILPGFVDLHVHGGGGTDTMEGEQALRQMARFHAQHGTTALLPTTVTAPIPDIEAALHGVRAVMDRPGSGEARVLGVHLEGPFISPQRLGAQPPYHLPPSIELMEHWMAIAPIKVVTLAPELEGAIELITFLHAKGVRVQAGHTAATFAQAVTGFKRGISGFTHLYNAMSALNHREPGVVGLALSQAQFAEIILDGLHVHSAAAMAAMRAIPQAYGVTDAVAAAGMPDGSYALGRHTVFKKGEGVFLADGTLAGSALTMQQALRNLLAWGVGLSDGVQRLSQIPKRYLGLPTLAIGQPADWVVLNRDMTIERVYIAGERVR